MFSLVSQLPLSCLVCSPLCTRPEGATRLGRVPPVHPSLSACWPVSRYHQASFMITKGGVLVRKISVV